MCYAAEMSVWITILAAGALAALWEDRRRRRARAHRWMTAEEANRRAAEPSYGHELSILLPAPIQPMERLDRFEIPLDEALSGLGTVHGGGSRCERVDGKLVIRNSCLDLSVADPTTALPIIRKVLKAQGAPPGTSIRVDREDEQPL
jgi:hypothetical protein